MERSRRGNGAALAAIGLLLVWTIGVSGALAAGVFYVDGANPACSDTASGIEEQPYCTITAAARMHGGAGTTILVKPAVYREQVTVPMSGAPGEPFVFRAMGSPVVLDGSESLSDPVLWISVPGGAWLASSVTWTPKQVLVDGERLLESEDDPSTLPPGSFRVVADQGLYVNIGGDNPGLRETFVGKRGNGFRVNARSWITIEGFDVTRCDDVGIYVLSGSTDIRIAGNRSSWNSSTGITVVGTARAEVIGNTVSDNRRHGIYLVTGTTQSVVDGNEAMRNRRNDGVGINGIKIESSSGNVVQRNRMHHNQDSGLQINFSHDTISRLNMSWNNGDHGFDHLGSLRVLHVSELSYGNEHDGFSFEGGSSDASVYDSILVNNGLATGSHDLFVDGTSAPGFRSDSNVIWNDAPVNPIRFNAVNYPVLASFTAATGQETRGLQQDPMFTDAASEDFRLVSGSPAIDSADALAPSWPDADIDGRTRVDDPGTGNAGTGPVLYADRGALEFYGNCNAGAGPWLESCDGLDNDCDGAVDDGYPVGQTCTVGIGACSTYGVTSCSLDGLGTFCSATPGLPQPEVCDGVDNNCDGLTDNAAPPSGRPQMEAALPSSFQWTALPDATSYQVVRGSLSALAASSGDFTTATGQCLAAAEPGTSLSDGVTPLPGQGFWYLVRGVNCGGGGTWNSGAASQSGQRDAEIAASPQHCP